MLARAWFCKKGAWQDAFGVALKKAWEKDGGNPPVRTLSLFSGAGGLDIGFHDAGFASEAMVELEPAFARTLHANTGPGGYWEKARIAIMDVRAFEPPEGGGWDFLLGGPPCQSFSAAGRRAAGVEGTADARGQLFAEYARILGQVQPRGFLFENVYGLTGAQGGEALRAIESAFRDVGYRLSWRVLDTADYGVPQHRERLILVGVREDLGLDVFRFPRPTHGPDAAEPVPFCGAEQALHGLDPVEGEAGGINGRHGHLLDAIPPGLNYSFYTEKLGHPEPLFAWRSKFSDYLYKADPEVPVRTLKAQGGQYTGPFHWGNRRFTVAELKRLQTIPDAYLLTGGRGGAIRQIGNSVPPQFARILACAVREQFFGARSPVALGWLEPDEELGFRRRQRSRTAAYQKVARQSHSGAKRLVRERGKTRSGNRWARWDGTNLEIGPENTGGLRSGEGWWGFWEEDAEGWSVRVTGDLRRRRNAWFLDGEVKELGWGIRLSGTGNDPLELVVAWRVWETVLREAGIRDDLVQLNGYYQYDASLKCRLTPPDSVRDADLWKLLVAVTEGEVTREILPLEVLGERSELGEPVLNRLLPELRAALYEVRSHRTNPQIPEGSFLIPYGFPSLTSQSVKRRQPLWGGG